MGGGFGWPIRYCVAATHREQIFNADNVWFVSAVQVPCWWRRLAMPVIPRAKVRTGSGISPITGRIALVYFWRAVLDWPQVTYIIIQRGVAVFEPGHNCGRNASARQNTKFGSLLMGGGC